MDTIRLTEGSTLLFIGAADLTDKDVERARQRIAAALPGHKIALITASADVRIAEIVSRDVVADYAVLRGGSTPALEAVVKERLAAGYALAGGVASDSTGYSQAVVKYRNG